MLCRSLISGKAFSRPKGVWGLGQGPPGTGKTSAIVALVSALCAKRRAAAAAAGAGELADGAPAGSAAHVLVCAQSNAAVDELVVRLAAHSTSDGQLTGCGPAMLLGKHPWANAQDGLLYGNVCAQSGLSPDAHEGHHRLE